MSAAPRRTGPFRRPAFATLAVAGCLTGLTALCWPMMARTRPVPRAVSAGAAMPQTVLWAWERPEDFRSLKGEGVAVAFLAQTIKVNGGSVTRLRRHQRLELSPLTPLIAVTRIETGSRPIALAPDEADRVAASIADLARLPRVGAVQIDFDATVSERPFYRALIEATRRRLVPGAALSMTALMSWCMEDDWTSGLPVDEMVPMAFRMGVADRQAWQEVAASGRFRVAGCRTSIGLSTDEPIRRSGSVGGRRVYMFHPKPWTEASIAAAVGEINRWR